MYSRTVGRAVLMVSALALAACAQAPRDKNPRITDPLPPPSNVSTGGVSAVPQTTISQGAGPQDIVLRGVAYAESGDGRYPPNSQMTVRVYDAATGDINEWQAEETFTRSGALPWPYSMNFRTEAFSRMQQPALAARIDGPDGRLIYQSERVVLLKPGGAEDIPMSVVTGGGASGSASVDKYVDAQIKRGPEPSYGIPDYDSTYGAQTYDTPLYPGQSYRPTSFSGPPSNGVF